VFETRIKVRFGDVDKAGIAYYPTIVNYFHVAFEEFFEGFVHVPYDRFLAETGLGFPAARLEIEFRAPLRFGDVVTVQVSVVRIGQSSVRFRYRILGPQGAEHAEALVTVVCVDLESLAPVPIPAEVQEIFRRCLEEDSGDDR
jgi:4-hydroxybenzoyl-CoA thioesterase